MYVYVYAYYFQKYHQKMHTVIAAKFWIKKIFFSGSIILVRLSNFW